MEEGDRSGGVIKKKSSSGCLIIKKKGAGAGCGVGSSGSHKQKKRHRLFLSDSGSSDEFLEPLRRKVEKLREGSVVYGRGVVDDTRNGGIESERKRNRMDLFEFDEYDEFDGKRMRSDYVDDRLKLIGPTANQREFRSGSSGNIGNQREFRSGSSGNIVVYKRRQSHFENTSSVLGGRNKGVNYSVKNRFEMDEEESHLPISSLKGKFREASDEPIRLQGKNGVLKVMVNKKKPLGLSREGSDHQEAEDRKGSRSEDVVKKNLLIRPLFYSHSKHPEKPLSSVRTEKSELKLRKSLLTKSIKAGDSDTDDSDTSLKLRMGSSSAQAHKSTKGGKSGGKSSVATKKITPIRGKEGKVKCGNGTEKQMLREQIRSMLVNAGWTIDYRPRRNRDYQDAVYINTAGTAYWSIIKAYDAFKKQLEEEDNDIKHGVDSSAFTSISVETLSKLTRRTRKKIEKELKKKRRDDGSSKNAKEAAMKEPLEGTDYDHQEEKLSFHMKQNRKSLKGRTHEVNHVTGDDSSDSTNKGTREQECDEKPSNSDMLQGRKSRKIGRCTLLVRSSDNRQNWENDGYVPYTGKRTVLAWLIDSGIVQLNEKVQYMNRRRARVMLEGWITRDGIHCGCCSKILSVSKFELHAGTKHRQPFRNMILESGVSLLQCQMDAWNRREERERRGFNTIDIDDDDPNDDTCGVCGDGGDLICCDGCPATFHQDCLDIKMLPPGDWYCLNCTCKICGIASGSASEGDNGTVGALFTCSLCEKKYHKSCSQEMDDLPADSVTASTTFCGQKCQELFDQLQKLIGIKHELEAGFFWSLVRRTDPDSDTSNRGFSQRVESNSKLALAVSVMDECFLPIFDRRSGINLMHNVLYNCGSNLSRLNFSGFYTAILERGDEIISAASIRFHGTQLVEMPFIGTRHIYRRQGMFRRLLCAIESALCSLKVKKLIIPAIAEHMHTWTVVFGFNPLEESQKQELKSINMLVFPGTDMLHKQLVKQEIPEGNITVNSGTKSVEFRDSHLLVDDSAKKSEIDPSTGPDHHVHDDEVRHVNAINDKVADLDSGSQTPSVPLDDSTVMTDSLDASRESVLVSSKNNISIKCPSANEVAESIANVSCPSPSGASTVSLEMETFVMHSPVKDHNQSSTEGVTCGTNKVDVEAPSVGSVLDSLGETSARIMTEANDNQDSVSTVLGYDESTLQINSNVNHHNALEMESELHLASVVAADTEVSPIEGNIRSSVESSGVEVHGVNGEVTCGEPGLGSLSEISARSTKGKVDEKENSAPVSTLPSTGTCTAEFNSDLNHSSALDVERELHASSELLPHAEVASDAKVARVEGDTQSSGATDSGDNHKGNDNIACVNPASDFLGENYAQNTKETKENQNPVSAFTLCGTDKGLTTLNYDLDHQCALEVESKIPVATEFTSENPVSTSTLHGTDGGPVTLNIDLNHQSALVVESEFGSVAKVAPAQSNFQSSAVGDMDDNLEINVKITHGKSVLDSSGEISITNTAEAIDVNQNPVVDESGIVFNPDLNQQAALEVESKVFVASAVLSNEATATESYIQSNGEGKVGDAHEGNVEVASVGPVLDSFGEALAQNSTESTYKNPLESSSCKSEESSLQLKSVLNHRSAVEMERELHLTREVASNAMHCENDIQHPSHEN